MDSGLRRQELLERAQRVDGEARREQNTQAQDLLRALAALYREMAEELDVSALFERRFLLLDFADLAGGDQSISAGNRTGMAVLDALQSATAANGRASSFAQP